MQWKPVAPQGCQHAPSACIRGAFVTFRWPSPCWSVLWAGRGANDMAHSPCRRRCSVCPVSHVTFNIYVTIFVTHLSRALDEFPCSPAATVLHLIAGGANQYWNVSSCIHVCACVCVCVFAPQATRDENNFNQPFIIKQRLALQWQIRWFGGFDRENEDISLPTQLCLNVIHFYQQNKEEKLWTIM